MKKYRIKGPDGTWWETAAKTLAEAKSNLAFRLKKAGMFIADAYIWAADAKEVPE